jgi:ribonuclease HI
VQRHGLVTWWTKGHDGDHINEMAGRIAAGIATNNR